MMSINRVKLKKNKMKLLSGLLPVALAACVSLYQTSNPCTQHAGTTGI